MSHRLSTRTLLALAALLALAPQVRAVVQDPGAGAAPSADAEAGGVLSLPESAELDAIASGAERQVTAAWLLAPGQESPTGPVTPPPGPDVHAAGLGSNQFLLGDLWGLHPRDETPGVSLFVSNIQYQQGVVSGGARQAGRWGSKFDMLAHLDTQGLGLWKGGSLDLFAESRLGNSIEGFAGVFSPTNLAMFFPLPAGEVTALTGLKFTQMLGDRLGIFAGKLNALNGDRSRFLSYPLTSRFWNAAFNFNLALDRYPYSAPGAGLFYVLDPGPTLSLLVLDSHSSPTTSGLANLGRNGVFLYAEARQATSFWGLSGSQKLAGLYGSGKFDDLDPASFINLPAGSMGPRVAGTWTLLWEGSQRLIQADDDPERGLGLYAQLGLGDGNPNPVRWFGSVALCGNSPLPGRNRDLFGVGFYQVGLGSLVKQLVPQLRDEPGVEIFYDARLGPGCHFTPDIQIIQPGLGSYDTAIVLGARLKLDF